MISRLTRRKESADESTSVGSIAWRVLLLLGLLGVVGGMAYLRSFPPMATVMSESMQPKISVGDIVLFKNTAGTTPAVGDIVEVTVPAELQKKHGYPGKVIHRVIDVNADGTVTTKGDNLSSPDPFETKVSSISRTVVVTIPMAGRLLGFVFSPFGLLWLAIGLVIFVVMPFYDVQKERAELHHIEVAALGELQAKVDRATAWNTGQNDTIVPFAPSAPPSGSTALDVRGPFTPEWAAEGPAAPVVVAPDPVVKETLGELVSAVGEYGEHLRSHTEILKSMSAASQDLAKVVAELQRNMPVTPVMPTAPAAAAAPAPVAPVPAAPAVVAPAPTLPAAAPVPIPPRSMGGRLLAYLTAQVGPTWAVVDATEIAAASRSDVTAAEVRAAMVELVARGAIELHPVQPPDLFRVRVI